MLEKTEQVLEEVALGIVVLKDGMVNEYETHGFFREKWYKTLGCLEKRR